jgi:Protein of unknown function (DUF3551)
VTSFMLQCGFETLAQCQETSFGRGGDCFRNPSLGSAAMRTTTRRVSARRTPTHRFDGNNKEHAFGAATAGVMFQSKPLREG